MRKLTTCLIIAVLLGSSGSAFALPPCPSDQSQYYDNCFGTWTYPSGDKYVGEWRNNKRNGQGTYTFGPSSKWAGDKYVGEYRNGKRHGQGTATFASGDKYVGEHRNGKEHGQGSYTHASGNKYVGEYRDGKRHGQGTYTWANGHKYVGEYRNGKKNGQGTFTYGPSSKWAGDKFVGEYRNGKRNGQGTYTSANGDKYVGEWRNDKPHGQGIEYHADGTVDKEGIWKDGKFQYAQNVTPPVIASKSPPSKSAAELENERLRRENARLKKERQSKPQIDPQKRLELARRTQEALQVMGLYSGKLDGIIGVRTRSAIRGWQRRKGYTETGEITENQIVRLEQDATLHLANIAAHKKAEEDKQKQQELARQKAREEKKRKLAEARRNKVTNPDGVAVIIGNQNYTHGRVSKVAYAKRDAAAFKRYVTDVLGFRKGNIIDLRDATQAQMMAAFGNRDTHQGKLWRYLNPKRGSDVVVFYSGHGVPGQRSQRGYLLPVDADPNGVEINGYPIDLLYTNLGKLKAAKSIRVFLDACFSGDSHSGMLIRSASPVYFTAVLPKAKKKLTVLTAASGSQLASWDEKARHGLFTHHLLDALYGRADANTDGRITAAETKEYLDEHMTMAARRTYGREQTASLIGAAASVLAAREGKTFPQRPASLPR